MIIAYFSNFLNHHQKLVADELASTEGIDYIFVETVPMYDWLKKGGYRVSKDCRCSSFWWSGGAVP